MAFSLVGGLALSWAGAYIQYKLAPKIIGKMKTRTQTVGFLQGFPDKNWFSDFTYVPMNITEIEYNKVAAKMFGTITTDIAGIGFDSILSNMKKSTQSSSTSVSLNAMTEIRESEDFGIKLQTALKEQSFRTVDEIGDLGEEIDNSSDYGKTFLNHERVKAQKNDMSKLEEVRKLIIQDINILREIWKVRWFYYGNDPKYPAKDQMEKAIEREIWAFWVLKRNIHWEKASRTGDSYYLKTGIREHKARVSGEINDLILYRLAELDVISAQTDWQAIRQHRRLNPIGGKPQEVNVPGIDGDIDTQKEVKAINKWAEEHKPDLITGNLRATPRELRSVENLHGKG